MAGASSGLWMTSNRRRMTLGTWLSAASSAGSPISPQKKYADRAFDRC